LQEYKDVFPKEVPNGFPPLSGIEHQLISFLEPHCPIGLHIEVIPGDQSDSKAS